MTPDTHRSFSDTALCAYTASPLLFGTQLHMKTKLAYLMTAYYTLNDSFTATMHHFYMNIVDLL